MFPHCLSLPSLLLTLHIVIIAFHFLTPFFPACNELADFWSSATAKTHHIFRHKRRIFVENVPNNPSPSPLSQQPCAGQGRLILAVSRSHTMTSHSVGLLWKRDRPVAEHSTWQHTAFTRERHTIRRRDSNPQSQQAIGRRLLSQTARPLESAAHKSPCVLMPEEIEGFLTKTG